MTHVEADNLIATLPKPGGLRLFREDDRIVMDGGKFGPHTLSAKVSSAERLLVHWKGYVENQGLTLGPGYTAERPAPALIPHLKSSERDYEPGDKIAFSSPSYSGKGDHGWRPGVVVRATPKRVLVEYSFKYDLEQAKKTGKEPRRHEIWKKRTEVQKR
jgi:hypothetical protein